MRDWVLLYEREKSLNILFYVCLVFNFLDIKGLWGSCSFVMFLGLWLLFCAICLCVVPGSPKQDITFRLLHCPPILSVSDPSCQNKCPEIFVVYPTNHSPPLALLIGYRMRSNLYRPRLHLPNPSSYPYISSPLQLCVLSCCVLSLRAPFLLSLNPTHPQMHSCSVTSHPRGFPVLRHNSC